MSAKKKPSKKPSGKNIPNAQRKTVMLLLRLPPEVADRIAELADAWRITKAGAVARLLAEFEGEEPE